MRTSTSPGPGIGSGAFSSSFITSGLPNSRTTNRFHRCSPQQTTRIERRARGARRESSECSAALQGCPRGRWQAERLRYERPRVILRPARMFLSVFRAFCVESSWAPGCYHGSFHAIGEAPQDGGRQSRPRPGWRRRACRRPVDDDDRHRRCGVDRAAMHRAGRSGIGNGARHGEPARGRGGRSRDQAAHARRRRQRAAHRRLPLQRPPAADAFSRLRTGARQVPHQSRQRRHRQAPRRAVLDHLQGRGRPRQAGAHRRQRRLAEPGAGRREDAGEHRSRSRQVVRGHHQRVHGALRRRVDGARDRERAAQGSDHHLVQDVAAARPDRGLPRARAARPISRCTSA